MEFLNNLIQQCKSLPPEQIIFGLIGLLAIFFLIQLYFLLIKYSGIPAYRNIKNKSKNNGNQIPPVSVIVVLRENTYYYIENYLPILLTQDHPQYEVVVVDCSYDEEISNILQEMCLQYPILHTTKINEQHNINHGTKLAITVGIKASKYENLILTTADCYPASERWLSLMAKGFINGDVVIGYCAIEKVKGALNKLIRCNRLFSSIQYLSAAIRSKTYRGIAHNIGYTKSLYFQHKGFNYLNMNIGDDDLFIQKIATRNNVSVVMNPNATVFQIQYGGIGWWRTICKFYSRTFHYYPFNRKCSIRTELISRLIFNILAILAIVVLPLHFKAVPISMMVIRLIAVEMLVVRAGKRLGDRGIWGMYILYDLYAPISKLALYMKPSRRNKNKSWN